MIELTARVTVDNRIALVGCCYGCGGEISLGPVDVHGPLRFALPLIHGITVRTIALHGSILCPDCTPMVERKPASGWCAAMPIEIEVP